MYPYISIFGQHFGTYGLCMVLGFFLPCVLTVRRGKPLGITPEDVFITAATALLGALVCGGGLYVAVTYSFEEIIGFIRRGEFSFLGSGIVFYGGLIGGVLGALLGIGIAKCSLPAVERATVPFIPLGHAVGRIGCVMAGCCHGFEYSGPFALYYPNSVAGLDPAQGYFPVQLVEALANGLVCAALLRLSKKERKPFDLLFFYLGLYGVERFLLEILRGDEIRGIYGGLSVSQWISLGLLLACGIHFLRQRLRKSAKVG